MAGAYVAKPAVASEVDYPPGWDINWPFPGPFPPGYTYSLSHSPDYFPEPGIAGGSGDDSVQIMIFACGDAETSETGKSCKIGVLLIGNNDSPITVTLFPDIENELEVNAFGELGSVTFDASETDIPKFVEVTGTADDLDDGDTDVGIVGIGESSNPDYDGLESNTITITNTDGETTLLYPVSTYLLCTESVSECVSVFLCPAPPFSMCSDAGYEAGWCNPDTTGILLSSLIDNVKVAEPDSNVYAGHWRVYLEKIFGGTGTVNRTTIASGIVDRYGYARYTGSATVTPYFADGSKWIRCECDCVELSPDWPFYCCADWEISVTETVGIEPSGDTYNYYIRVYW
jgi:hypothetical protein